MTEEKDMKAQRGGDGDEQHFDIIDFQRMRYHL